MAIQYATQVQVETAREAAEKLAIAFQQLVQGSQRPSRVSAARLTELDAFVTAMAAACTAISSAVVDNTPNAFVFTDLTGVPVSSGAYISNAITVAGMSDNVGVAITVTGGQYSVNNGAFTASAGTAYLGDTVRAKATASGVSATAVNCAVTIGGVADTLSVTTA